MNLKEIGKGVMIMIIKIKSIKLIFKLILNQLEAAMY